MRVCSRHFPDEDTSQTPSLVLGKRFSSPTKKDLRSKRARVINEKRSVSVMSLASSRSVTPSTLPNTSGAAAESSTSPSNSVLTAPIGEQLQCNFSIDELPTGNRDPSPNITALEAEVEFLRAENDRLKRKCTEQAKTYFRIENIKHDDSLVTLDLLAMRCSWLFLNFSVQLWIIFSFGAQEKELAISVNAYVF